MRKDQVYWIVEKTHQPFHLGKGDGMISLLLTLAVVGFLVYVIVTYIPMEPIFKTAISVIAIILVLLYLVKLFGVDIPMPR